MNFVTVTFSKPFSEVMLEYVQPPLRNRVPAEAAYDTSYEVFVRGVI